MSFDLIDRTDDSSSPSYFTGVTNGGVHYVLEYDNLGTTCAYYLHTSTNPEGGGSWGKHYLINQPVSLRLRTKDVHLEGDVLHMVAAGAGASPGYYRYIYYGTINVVTKVQTDWEFVVSTSDYTVYADVSASIWCENSIPFIVHNCISDAIMGTDYRRLFLDWKESGVWDGGVMLHDSGYQLHEDFLPVVFGQYLSAGDIYYIYTITRRYNSSSGTSDIACYVSDKGNIIRTTVCSSLGDDSFFSYANLGSKLKDALTSTSGSLYIPFADRLLSFSYSGSADLGHSQITSLSRPGITVKDTATMLVTGITQSTQNPSYNTWVMYDKDRSDITAALTNEQKAEPGMGSYKDLRRIIPVNNAGTTSAVAIWLGNSTEGYESPDPLNPTYDYLAFTDLVLPAGVDVTGDGAVTAPDAVCDGSGVALAATAVFGSGSVTSYPALSSGTGDVVGLDVFGTGAITSDPATGFGIGNNLGYPPSFCSLVEADGGTGDVLSFGYHSSSGYFYAIEDGKVFKSNDLNNGPWTYVTDLSIQCAGDVPRDVILSGDILHVVFDDLYSSYYGIKYFGFDVTTEQYTAVELVSETTNFNVLDYQPARIWVFDGAIYITHGADGSWNTSLNKWMADACISKRLGADSWLTNVVIASSSTAYLRDVGLIRVGDYIYLLDDHLGVRLSASDLSVVDTGLPAYITPRGGSVLYNDGVDDYIYICYFSVTTIDNIGYVKTLKVESDYSLTVVDTFNYNDPEGATYPQGAALVEHKGNLHLYFGDLHWNTKRGLIKYTKPLDTPTVSDWSLPIYYGSMYITKMKVAAHSDLSLPVMYFYWDTYSGYTESPDVDGFYCSDWRYKLEVYSLTCGVTASNAAVSGAGLVADGSVDVISQGAIQAQPALSQGVGDVREHITGTGSVTSAAHYIYGLGGYAFVNEPAMTLERAVVVVALDGVNLPALSVSIYRAIGSETATVTVDGWYQDYIAENASGTLTINQVVKNLITDEIEKETEIFSGSITRWKRYSEAALIVDSEGAAIFPGLIKRPLTHINYKSETGNNTRIRAKADVRFTPYDYATFDNGNRELMVHAVSFYFSPLRSIMEVVNG